MSVFWEPVKGSKLYEVSSNGSVRNVKTGTILKHTKRQYGRHRVTLHEDGKHKSVFVDDLMVDAFFEGDGLDRMVLYVDGDKDNLNLSNLCVRKRARTRVLEVVSGRIFDSQAECVEALGVPKALLSMCLNGRCRSYKGMYFVKID